MLAFLGASLLSCSVRIVDRSSLKSSERMRGVYHRVKPGETLWRISRAYNIDLQELAEINNITDSSRIGAGSVVFIPDAPEVIDIPPARQAAEAKPPAPPSAEKPAVVAASPESARPAAAAAAAGGPGKLKEESITDRPPPAGTDRAPAAGKPREKAPPGPAEKIDASTTPPSKGPAARPPAPAAAEKAPPRPPERSDMAAPSAAGTQMAMKPPAPAPSARAPDAALKDRTAVTPPPARKPEPAQRAEEPQGLIRMDKGRFAWPVRGPVITRFGIQPSGMKYNGIKIAAKENTSVQAAAAGTVIYASYVKGYGETVIVKHDESYTTVYAYLKNTVAKRDERIRKGDRLASIGPSQEPGGEPYLYFEIREKNKARNPLFFLP